MGGGKKGTDTSRAERKAKKRKLEDTIPDVPGDNSITEPDLTITTPSEEPQKKRKRDNDDDVARGDGVTKDKKKKKEKKDKKKDKKSNNEGEAESKALNAEAVVSKDNSGVGADNAVENGDAPKKSKKERKAERRAREAAEVAAKDGETPESTSTRHESSGAAALTPGKDKKAKKDKKKQDKMASTASEKQQSTISGKSGGKDARFIVFIGSLPYTATTASIQKHFASVKPISVRSPMQKDDPAKSKGYAFLEFDGYDHMKTCLKLFHHSTFDDGLSLPRKISVELTAGGGGNTKDRKNKIKAKN
ncbi:hypothetical protein OIDMADRAFT_16260, partial [Oidiodendron maius Zn]